VESAKCCKCKDKLSREESLGRDYFLMGRIFKSDEEVALKLRFKGE
jgi:hypothetical protein